MQIDEASTTYNLQVYPGDFFLVLFVSFLNVVCILLMVHRVC